MQGAHHVAQKLITCTLSFSCWMSCWNCASRTVSPPWARAAPVTNTKMSAWIYFTEFRNATNKPGLGKFLCTDTARKFFLHSKVLKFRHLQPLRKWGIKYSTKWMFYPHYQTVTSYPVDPHYVATYFGN